MKSIRRLYFYLVALISIEVVLWGLVGLLRSIAEDTISGGAEVLAGALALILVGLPIFLIHWSWAQRASARDEEERTATLRAVFFYVILFATLIPIVQNLLSFIDRLLVQGAGLGVSRAFSLFREQTFADNLIAILMNGIVAAYFWNILRGEWGTIPDRANFTEVRRLYRYLWMLYGLLMTVLGAQQVLRFLFHIPGDVLGEVGREVVVNGVALLLVGTPIWVYSWRLIQESLVDPAERVSVLRLGILYLLALGGVITVITAAWMVLDTTLTYLLGNAMSSAQFIPQISGPLSIGIPIGAMWAYYGYWLQRHIESVGDRVRQAGMKRLYYYILTFIGLAVTFNGVQSLLSFLIDMSAGGWVGITGGSVRSVSAAAVRIGNSLSLLIVGLPLWLTMWRPIQMEAWAPNEIGDHARRSLIRKSYLYLVLFASVIGGMAAAVGLVYEFIRVLLGSETGGGFVNDVLNFIQLLFLFSVVLVYHLNVLRMDGASTADSLADKQSRYSVLVVDSGSGFVESVKAALMKLGSRVQVTTTNPDVRPEGNFHAILLNGSLVLDAPQWIRSFNGSRIVVQNESRDIVWTDDAAQAAQSVQQLAEGQEIHKPRIGRSVWSIVVYVFAALFLLEVLFVLLTFSMSLVMNARF